MEPGTEEVPISDSSSHLLERGGDRRDVSGLCGVEEAGPSVSFLVLSLFPQAHVSAHSLSQLPEAESHRAPQLGDLAAAPKGPPDNLASCSLYDLSTLPSCSPFLRSLPLRPPHSHPHPQPCLHSPAGIREKQDPAEGPGAVVSSGPWKH